eukprot:gene22764-31054_t
MELLLHGQQGADGNPNLAETPSCLLEGQQSSVEEFEEV